MRSLYLIAAVLCINGSFAQKVIINDPNASVRQVGSFSAISISGGIDLYLSQGDEDAVAVSASDTKYRDKIRTEVEDGTLKIGFDNRNWKWNAGKMNMIVYVSFKSIKELSASGASNIIVPGQISGDELIVTLSGASDFRGTVRMSKLTVDQRGASDVTISGKVDHLDISAEGASDLKGYGLETKNCTVKASGASDIKITVQTELNARASGASSVLYKGSGVIKEMKSSGASSVKKG